MVSVLGSVVDKPILKCFQKCQLSHLRADIQPSYAPHHLLPYPKVVCYQKAITEHLMDLHFQINMAGDVSYSLMSCLFVWPVKLVSFIGLRCSFTSWNMKLYRSACLGTGDLKWEQFNELQVRFCI